MTNRTFPPPEDSNVLTTPEAVLAAAQPALVRELRQVLAHVLLPNAAFVWDCECASGFETAVLAALNPRLNFLGTDQVEAGVQRAAERYKLPNLEYRAMSPFAPEMPKASLDAIFNRKILGRLYTKANYDERVAARLFEAQVPLLKEGGFLCVFDHMRPNADMPVLLEFPMPEAKINSFQRGSTFDVEKTEGARDVANLIWFAQNAHAKPNAKESLGVQGFHLEERPAKKPDTKLFRLPYNWAREFLIRKRDLADFRVNVHQDFTCLSQADLGRLLHKAHGLRLAYQRPIVEANTPFEKALRLTREDGTRLPWPPAISLLLAERLGPAQSTRIAEHKRLDEAPPEAEITVSTLRDVEKGTQYDVVTPKTTLVDVLMWRTVQGRVQVLLEKTQAKPLLNLIPREAVKLDGRVWSGLMLGLPSIAPEHVANEGALKEPAAAVKVLRKAFQLTPRLGAIFVEGEAGFMAPDFIDAPRRCLRIELAHETSVPTNFAFFDAADVQRACDVGLLPDAWLNIQLSTLLEETGQLEGQEDWFAPELPIAKTPPPPDRVLRSLKILEQAVQAADPETHTPSDLNAPQPKALGNRFKTLRVPSGRVRAEQSAIAVEMHEEGRVHTHSGGRKAYAELPPEISNIAAILPLTQDFDGIAMVGFQMDSMPVPAKNGQNGPMVHLPTLPLPPTVHDVEEARAYVAQFFGTKIENVVRLAESFYTDLNVCNQRIYPFAVADAPWNGQYDIKYAPIYFLEDITKISNSTSLLWRFGYMMARRCLKAKSDKLFEPRKEVTAQRKGLKHKVNKLKT